MLLRKRLRQFCNRLVREASGRSPANQRVCSFSERINVRRRRQVLTRQRTSRELRCLYQRIMLRSRVNVCADARDGAIGGFDFRNSEVSNLYRLLIGSQEKVLRLDVSMNHPILVRVGESGRNLLEIEQRAFQAQRLSA